MSRRYVNSSAEISDDGIYRYRLDRRWGQGLAGVLWVMLNPSTADAAVDDPTIRRCVSFADRWGFDRTTIVNLYAYRATSPAVLLDVSDPVGPENANVIREVIGRHVGPIVFAWGASVEKIAYKRGRLNPAFWCHDDQRPMALGYTKTGHPRHPLYVPADVSLVPVTVAR